MAKRDETQFQCKSKKLVAAEFKGRNFLNLAGIQFSIAQLLDYSESKAETTVSSGYGIINIPNPSEKAE